MTINAATGALEAPPQIVAQGVRGLELANGSTKEAQRVVATAFARASRQMMADESLLKEHLRVELKRFIQKELGVKPVIVTVISQVQLPPSSNGGQDRLRVMESIDQ